MDHRTRKPDARRRFVLDRVRLLFTCRAASSESIAVTGDVPLDTAVDKRYLLARSASKRLCHQSVTAKNDVVVIKRRRVDPQLCAAAGPYRQWHRAILAIVYVVLLVPALVVVTASAGPKMAARAAQPRMLCVWAGRPRRFQ